MPRAPRASIAAEVASTAPTSGSVPSSTMPRARTCGSARTSFIEYTGAQAAWAAAPDATRDGLGAEALLADPEAAYISRYALGRDYHKLMRKRLKQLAERLAAEIAPHGR